MTLVHVGLTPDGNGRWAQARGLDRTEGHHAGAAALLRTVDAFAQVDGLQHLTVHLFSEENWNRPATEVSAIFEVIAETLPKLSALGAVRWIGRRDRVPHFLASALEQAEREGIGRPGLTLNLLIDYSGLPASIRAAQQPGGFDWADGLPPIDLYIRTSGEQRLSNFLLWHLAYAELYFTPTMWPDFTADDVEAAIDWYRSRKRRFGQVPDLHMSAKSAAWRSTDFGPGPGKVFRA